MLRKRLQSRALRGVVADFPLYDDIMLNKKDAKKPLAAISADFTDLINTIPRNVYKDLVTVGRNKVKPTARVYNSWKISKCMFLAKIYIYLRIQHEYLSKVAAGSSLFDTISMMNEIREKIKETKKMNEKYIMKLILKVLRLVQIQKKRAQKNNNYFDGNESSHRKRNLDLVEKSELGPSDNVNEFQIAVTELKPDGSTDVEKVIKKRKFDKRPDAEILKNHLRWLNDLYKEIREKDESYKRELFEKETTFRNELELLQEEMERVQVENNKLTESKQDIENELKEMEHRIQGYENVIQNLQNELDEMKSENEILQQNKITIEKEIEQKKNLLKTEKSELQNIGRENQQLLEEKNQQIERLQSKISEIVENDDKNKKELARLKANLEQLQANSNNTVQEVQTLKNEYERENVKLLQEKEELKKKMHETAQILETKELEFQERNAKLQEAVEDEKVKNERENQQLLEEKNQQIEELQIKISEIVENDDKNKKELAGLKATLEQLQNEKNSIQANSEKILQEAQALRDRYEGENAKLLQEKEKLEKQIQENARNLETKQLKFQHQKAELQQAIEDERMGNEQLNAEKNRIEEDNNEKNQRISELHENIANLQKEYEEFKNASIANETELQKELAELRSLNKNLENENRNIQELSNKKEREEKNIEELRKQNSKLYKVIIALQSNQQTHNTKVQEYEAQIKQLRQNATVYKRNTVPNERDREELQKRYEEKCQEYVRGIKGLQDENQEMKTKVENSYQLVEESKHRLEEQERQIQRLNQTQEELEQKVLHMNDLETQKEELVLKLESSNTHLEELRYELQKKEETIRDLQNTVVQHLAGSEKNQKTIEELQKQVGQKIGEINKLQLDYNDANTNISQLRNDIELLSSIQEGTKDELSKIKKDMQKKAIEYQQNLESMKLKHSEEEKALKEINKKQNEEIENFYKELEKINHIGNSGQSSSSSSSSNSNTKFIANSISKLRSENEELRQKLQQQEIQMKNTEENKSSIQEELVLIQEHNQTMQEENTRLQLELEENSIVLQQSQERYQSALERKSNEYNQQLELLRNELQEIFRQLESEQNKHVEIQETMEVEFKNHKESLNAEFQQTLEEILIQNNADIENSKSQIANLQETIEANNQRIEENKGRIAELEIQLTNMGENNRVLVEQIRRYEWLQKLQTQLIESGQHLLNDIIGILRKIIGNNNLNLDFRKECSSAWVYLQKEMLQRRLLRLLNDKTSDAELQPIYVLLESIQSGGNIHEDLNSVPSSSSSQYNHGDEIFRIHKDLLEIKNFVSENDVSDINADQFHNIIDRIPNMLLEMNPNYNQLRAVREEINEIQAAIPDLQANEEDMDALKKILQKLVMQDDEHSCNTTLTELVLFFQNNETMSKVMEKYRGNPDINIVETLLRYYTYGFPHRRDELLEIAYEIYFRCKTNVQELSRNYVDRIQQRYKQVVMKYFSFMRSVLKAEDVCDSFLDSTIELTSQMTVLYTIQEQRDENEGNSNTKKLYDLITREGVTWEQKVLKKYLSGENRACFYEIYGNRNTKNEWLDFLKETISGEKWDDFCQDLNNALKEQKDLFWEKAQEIDIVRGEGAKFPITKAFYDILNEELKNIEDDATARKEERVDSELRFSELILYSTIEETLGHKKQNTSSHASTSGSANELNINRDTTKYYSSVVNEFNHRGKHIYFTQAGNRHEADECKDGCIVNLSTEGVEDFSNASMFSETIKEIDESPSLWKTGKDWLSCLVTNENGIRGCLNAFQSSIEFAYSAPTENKCVYLQNCKLSLKDLTNYECSGDPKNAKMYILSGSECEDPSTLKQEDTVPSETSKQYNAFGGRFVANLSLFVTTAYLRHKYKHNPHIHRPQLEVLRRNQVSAGIMLIRGVITEIFDISNILIPTASSPFADTELIFCIGLNSVLNVVHSFYTSDKSPNIFKEMLMGMVSTFTSNAVESSANNFIQNGIPEIIKNDPGLTLKFRGRVITTFRQLLFKSHELAPNEDPSDVSQYKKLNAFSKEVLEARTVSIKWTMQVIVACSKLALYYYTRNIAAITHSVLFVLETYILPRTPNTDTTYSLYSLSIYTSIVSIVATIVRSWVDYQYVDVSGSNNEDEKTNYHKWLNFVDVAEHFMQCVVFCFISNLSIWAFISVTGMFLSIEMFKIKSASSFKYWLLTLPVTLMSIKYFITQQIASHIPLWGITTMVLDIFKMFETYTIILSTIKCMLIVYTPTILKTVLGKLFGFIVPSQSVKNRRKEDLFKILQILANQD